MSLKNENIFNFFKKVAIFLYRLKFLVLGIAFSIFCVNIPLKSLLQADLAFVFYVLILSLTSLDFIPKDFSIKEKMLTFLKIFIINIFVVFPLFRIYFLLADIFDFNSPIILYNIEQKIVKRILRIIFQLLPCIIVTILTYSYLNNNRDDYHNFGEKELIIYYANLILLISTLTSSYHIYYYCNK